MKLKNLLLPLLLFTAFSQALADDDVVAEARKLIAEGKPKQAFLMLKPQAKQGFAPAQYALAQLYIDGNGVTKNPEKAVQLFKQAAEQHHLGAANTLGKLYASGLDVPQNDEEATKWFTLAAQIADATGEDPEDCD